MSREKQIKSTDWLTKGYSEEELARIKAEAIKEADAELREKLIGEMAKTLGIAFQLAGTTRFGEVAEVLYNAGYRKSTEVAEEIFGEIEEMLNMQAKIVCQTRAKHEETDSPMLSFIAQLDGRLYSLRVVEEHIAELKKKYTEDK